MVKLISFHMLGQSEIVDVVCAKFSAAVRFACMFIICAFRCLRVDSNLDAYGSRRPDELLEDECS